MSITLNCAINTARILITLLQELAIVQSIIVERNLHAYYKLPAKQTHYNTQDYHILQCPYQNTTTIPAPEEMEICVIVNSYREQAKNATTTQATKSPLHTKVKYQMPSKLRTAPKRLTKRRKMHPYTIVIRPIRMSNEPMCAYPKTLRLQQTPHHAEHLGIVKKDNSRALQNLKPPDQRMISTKVSQNIVARVTPITLNLEAQAEGEEAEGSKSKSQSSEESEASAESDEADSQSESSEELTEFTDYDAYSERSAQKSEAVPTDSVLKYLGTKEAIEKLRQRQFSAHPLQDANQEAGGEKYFGEHKNYQQGEKVHGFQNYYHRDEIFNDHIFYDDLQQQGHYGSRGRA